MLADFASWFLVIATISVALFQLAIVLGAPIGEYAFGGQMTGVLPTRYRVSSVFSMLLMLAIAGHYLAQLGFFEPLLPPNLNAISNWGFVAFFVLAAIMNNITKSQQEKRVFGSTTIAMVLAAVMVAI
jgi:hypothetical protein